MCVCVCVCVCVSVCISTCVQCIAKMCVLPFRSGVCLCIFSYVPQHLQVVFASTLLVVCSVSVVGGGGGRGHVAIVIQKVRPMLC